jgi:Flp pilus assembly protein TadB
VNPLLVGAALGGSIGTGLVLVRRGLIPTRVTLADVFARAESPRQIFLGTPWTRTIETIANAKTNDSVLDADLAVLGRTRQQFALSRLSLTGTLAGLPLVVSALITAATGTRSNLLTVVTIAALLGAAGYVLSRMTLASEAAERRNGFVAELAAYLDMVAQLLTGGSGVEDALWRAARNARSPGVIQIRDALQSARTSRRSEWHALGALATRIRVPELGELVTAVQLAGSSGAKVSASLIAKAKSLRDRNAAMQLAAAQRSSERMGGPLIGMLLAFLVLVIAPALAAVMRI